MRINHVFSIYFNQDAEAAEKYGISFIDAEFGKVIFGRKDVNSSRTVVHVEEFKYRIFEYYDSADIYNLTKMYDIPNHIVIYYVSKLGMIL